MHGIRSYYIQLKSSNLHFQDRSCTFCISEIHCPSDPRESEPIEGGKGDIPFFASQRRCFRGLNLILQNKDRIEFLMTIFSCRNQFSDLHQFSYKKSPLGW